MSIPLLVVTISAEEFAADYVGKYTVGVVYRPQQIVKKGESEGCWRCLKITEEEPKEDSENWLFLGNVEAIVTSETVELGDTASEASAIAAAKVFAAGTPWVPVEELAEGATKKAAPAPELGVRSESANTVARLRGGVTMELGHEVEPEGQLFKLPPGFRPTGTVKKIVSDQTETVFRTLTITAAGVVSLVATELKAGETINLDISWPTS